MYLKTILPGAVVLLLSVRLLFAWSLPLEDEAEAHFAELARLMDDTQNPLVPRIDYDGTPMLQPLAVWLSALSLRFFGAGELVPRAPHFVLGLLVLGCCWHFARRQGLAADKVPVLLAAMPLLWLALGRVGADMALLLAMCLVCFSTWNLQRRRNSDDSMVLGLGLALGLLAAGPVIFLIAVPAVAAPVMLQRRLHPLFHHIQWSWLCLGLSLAPLWYLALFSAGAVTNASELWPAPADFSSLREIGDWPILVALLLWLALIVWTRPNLREDLPIYLVCWSLAPLLVLGLALGHWAVAAFLSAPPLALLGAMRASRSQGLAVFLPLLLVPPFMQPVSGTRELFQSTDPLRQVLFLSAPTFAEEYYSGGRARQVAVPDLPVWVNPGIDFYLVTAHPPASLSCEYHAASAQRQLHRCRLLEENR